MAFPVDIKSYRLVPVMFVSLVMLYLPTIVKPLTGELQDLIW